MTTPLWITAASIWTYWLIVIVMAVRSSSAGRSPGMTPQVRRERLMWYLWVPVIVGWNALPAVALRKDDAPWAVPDFATSWTWYGTVRWGAAALVLVCLALTMVCWRRMGPSWRVAVVPGQKTKLITGGPFRLVRHPIYALSVAMITATLVVLPTWPMAIITMAHWTLMTIKARGEERHLLDVHGETYRAYCRRTGRFVPRVGTGA